MTGTKSVTPLQRQKHIESVADAFYKHLTSVPGTVLPAQIRLGVAKCAQQAAFCEGCNSLPPGTCLRPGVKFSKVCSDLDHRSSENSDAFPFEHCQLNVEQISLLTSTVHAIVRHQGRLDKQWYAETIEALRRSSIIKLEQDDPDALSIDAAFCEITYLSAMTHGIHMVFLLLDKKTPALPSFDDISATLKPLNVHFPSMLKKVHRDDKVAFAPFFVARDINQKSNDFKVLSPELQDFLLERTKMSIGPWAASVFALTDFQFFTESVKDVFYAVTGTPNFRKPLRQDVYCPGVTRYDLETVAGGLTGALECTY